MIEDGKNITTAQKAQVCIIGSGPAGITAAYELSKAGVDVLLLDGSRKLDYSRTGYYQLSWNDKVRFYNGIADGLFAPNECDFLIRGYNNNPNFPTERERVYGGTSTHWGGQNRPLDPIAFVKRPGFPGWPITREDLDDFYAKACVLNHLYGDYYGHYGPGSNFTAEFWETQIQNQGGTASIPDLENFNTEMYQFMSSQWLNFATRTFDGKTIDSYVRVIVNATLLNIVEQGGSVQHLNVGSMTDDTSPQKATEFKVTADVYILALGTVENARQLLLSGVGNDLVGHYFMCHPLSQTSIIETTNTYLSGPESNLLDGRGWKDPTQNINGIQGRFIATADAAISNGIGRCWFWANDQFQYSNMYMEMAPNYNSYVALLTSDVNPPPNSNCAPPSRYTDPIFGQPLTYINWQFTDLDRKTYETNCSLFDKARYKAKNPQYRIPSIISWPKWETLLDQWVVNGHHIGTTRMSASTAPTEGVVDENLKIHGIDNMYVAGASVFCTTEVSNPTMTIIALSIRLGEYLKSQVVKKSTY